ncbi:putative lysosomal cystine transporter [Medicago truncatula]|uniref:Cystinosin homolog n=1 Tax=Medicago truncatula TaxID=3880 RepID=A0A396HD27_MEDTR|nr:putative lysosomal cystine transporter [Medicago truncatula]
MVPWNSFPLQIIYQIFGWLAFLSWSLAGYPQLISNFRRKSVVGLSLDYTILNFTKHWSYLIYNASLFFSPVIQKQYFEKYGYGQMIPVAANDVAFSTHAVIINLIVISQFAIYGVSTYNQLVEFLIIQRWYLFSCLSTLCFRPNVCFEARSNMKAKTLRICLISYFLDCLFYKLI